MTNLRTIKIKEKLRRLSDHPGVYMMKDRLGGILYVGKAKNLKKRVSTYFQPSRKFTRQQPKILAMIELVHDIEIIEVKSEAEALLLEGRLIKEWKPRYNTDFTDDKRFLLVRVDVENVLPRFRLVRFRKQDSALYFGPFAHSGLLRKTLSEMQKRFGILLSDAQPSKLESGSWQLYDDIRSEIYGHKNIVSETEYEERVKDACIFLEGKSREWLVELKAEMMLAAESRAFEKAAELRDIVQALEKTIHRTRRFERSPAIGLSKDPNVPLAALKEALQMSELPARIECFDISHISGNFCVASMVRYANGKADKRHYRRFRIKSFIGNDDFRAMSEVVGRRYKRLHEEKKEFPQLVVIDGGKGQVAAALRAFLTFDLEPPLLIGLAKKRETIIFTDDRVSLNLPLHHEGLKLLQRIRDEAHRFANTYNADLRSSKIRETILDEFDGLGKVKRRALLDHFNTMEHIKKASPEELRKVQGIGPKLADALYRFLHPDR